VPAINIITNGDGCWPDLSEKRRAGHAIWHLGNDAPAIQFALLKGGMVSGYSSVTIRIDLSSGDVVLAETSLGLLVSAVNALRAVPGASIPS
jgi:hypothetical protein